MRSAAPHLALIGALSLGAVCVAPVQASEAPAHKITQAESYVGLDPIYATVLDNGRPAGLLLVSIGLDIPDAALRERVTAALPLLRDHYVRNLMAFTAAAVRPWRQPDVDIIAKRLQGVTDRVLKQDGAQVLLGQVMIRITR